MRLINQLQAGALAAALVAATGCHRSDQGIRVYTTANDATNTPAPAPSAASGDMRASTANIPVNSAHITWTTPSAWKELAPDGVRIGNFSIPGENGTSAEAAIFSFPGSVGTELENVNRWRNELQLPPIEESQITSKPVTVGDSEGKLYEINGETKHTVVAVVPRDGATWFFKMRGDKAIIDPAEPVFIDFLKTIKFGPKMDAIPSPSVATTTSEDTRTNAQAPADATVGADANSPTWSVPANWTAKEPGMMVFKAFTAETSAGKPANVSISFFQGSVGGTFANVNRWRAQMSLAPVEEGQLGSVTQALTTPGGPATLVDFSGTDSRSGEPGRLVAVELPHGDSVWFFKLTGAADAVKSEKDKFVKFVQSVHYP